MDIITLFAITLLVYVGIAAVAYEAAFEKRTKRHVASPHHTLDVQPPAATNPSLMLPMLGLLVSGALITVAVMLVVHALTSGESWFGVAQQGTMPLADSVVAGVLLLAGIYLLVAMRRLMRQGKTGR